ncbi:hypothetical protein PR048_033693 [Dryococelus australis]|uniref:CCHC-type domain-containing protein n=1 Tax=Dryococelus australis TaxID=614101 RepID=A0ABQ9G108_9NEOP|nr:hypothetical protein PR048_033693 [Dryococelus australis]
MEIELVYQVQRVYDLLSDFIQSIKSFHDALCHSLRRNFAELHTLAVEVQSQPAISDSNRSGSFASGPRRSLEVMNEVTGYKIPHLKQNIKQPRSLRCANCAHFGHVAANCKANKQSFEERWCFRCNKVGHERCYCRCFQPPGKQQITGQTSGAASSLSNRIPRQFHKCLATITCGSRNF